MTLEPNETTKCKAICVLSCYSCHKWLGYAIFHKFYFKFDGWDQVTISFLFQKHLSYVVQPYYSFG